MLRFFLILFSLSFLFQTNHVDIKKLHSTYVLKKNKIKFRKNLEEKIESTFLNPSGNIDQKKWNDLFEELNLLFVKNDTIKKALDFGFDNFYTYGYKLKRTLLETAYTLYPRNYIKKTAEISESTSSLRIFAYSANYLLNADTSYKPAPFLKTLEEKFSSSSGDWTYRQFRNDLKTRISGKFATPPLEDMLSHNFQKGKTIIYTLVRKDRTKQGLCVIKGPDGKFVRNEDGAYFTVPHMAVAAANLPSYLKGGNTPQGIFSIVGWYNTPTESIGPTPIVLTRIPHEVKPNIFYHKQNKHNRWNVEDYRGLLPESWKNYEPVYNAFYEGKIGRGLIVAHGTCDDLSFYKDLPYYPWTPTKGCLSAKEIWDENTGRLIESDQVKLMNAFFSTNKEKGFLVIIEINDKNEPVSAEEVIPFLESVENTR